MPSLKRLKSVCHDIGHHAVSGLSWINPHVSRACRLNDLEYIEVNLLEDEPYPKNIGIIDPLQKSLLALKGKFEQILNSEGFTKDDLSGVILKLSPSRYKSDYCIDCFVSLTHKSGKTFSRGVDYLGRIILVV